MSDPNTGPVAPPDPPRGIAIAGVVFSALFFTSVVLIRMTIPADPHTSGADLAEPHVRDWVQLALGLVPFAGIAFLWFMAVLRHRIGLREDRVFATVFLGSGLLFVAAIFTAVAAAQGVLDALKDGAAPEHEAIRLGRAMTYTMINTFGMRMAAVFMFVTSSIGLRTGVLARWVSYLGFACGLALLAMISRFAWITLLFPVWTLLVSLHLLGTDRVGRLGPAGTTAG